MRWVGRGDPEGHTGRLGRNKIYQKLNVFLQYHGRLGRDLIIISLNQKCLFFIITAGWKEICLTRFNITAGWERTLKKFCQLPQEFKYRCKTKLELLIVAHLAKNILNPDLGCPIWPKIFDI